MILKIQPDLQKSKPLQTMAEITPRRLNRTNMKDNIDEQTRQFLQQTRDYRNRIAYEGFLINENYIHLNKAKIEKIISHFFRLIEKGP